SRPDDLSPRDHIGHGTAVAMAAAGVTNSGPADTITGVAPGAFLGSYKVYGSPGANDFTYGDVLIRALDDAIEDGMDIIVLSSGAPAFTAPLDRTCTGQRGGICDPVAWAFENAADSGIVVVAAAGNNATAGIQGGGGALATVQSPADAPGVLAVGAIANSHLWNNPITVEGLGTISARFGDGPLPPQNFSAQVVDLTASGDTDACAPLPGASLTGSLALVSSDNCGYPAKVRNMTIAGAVGVIIANDVGGNSIFTPTGLAGTSIPAMLIGNSDSQLLRQYLANHQFVEASINPIPQAIDSAFSPAVTSFSSRGPIPGAAVLKPDVVAVGLDLYLAAETFDSNGELYSPTGYVVSQGTSFSAAQVAGVAALVKQVHPGFTVDQIRSAIVNTATNDINDGSQTASVMAAGAGKVDARAAVTTSITVSPASISLGIVTAGVLPLLRQIDLTNVSSADLTLTFDIAGNQAEISAHTGIDLTRITLSAGQTGHFTLSLVGAVPLSGTYQGAVLIRGDGINLRVPYFYIVPDGTPYDLLTVGGDGDDGTAGQQSSTGYLIAQLTDHSGVPIAGVPVSFGVQSGGGSVKNASTQTDGHGFVFAEEWLGPLPGPNVFTLTAGGLKTSFSALGIAEPQITAITGIADQSDAGGIAPGSYVSLYGSHLAAETTVAGREILPISLDGVSVSFASDTVNAGGHLFYVSPGQINVQVPWELEGFSNAVVQVRVGDSVSASVPIGLASWAPEFLQVNGVAAAVDQSGQVVSSSNPAAQGSIVQLYATGLGPVTNQPNSGYPADSAQLSLTTVLPEITIGDQNAVVQYSGLMPGSAGLYQINVLIPSIEPGTHTVRIHISGALSPVSYIPTR
ncbi:MAG: S8 family serine peptidase, partial [Acidobacteriota bacterium]|nr:S8 family serine peptidase [Acidobacteriota bacterium]